MASDAPKTTDAARAELERDSERFRALARSAFDQITEVDAEGRTLYLSAGPEDPTGGFQGIPALGDVHEEDRDDVARAFTRALSAGESLRIAFRVIDAEGTRWIECTMTPLGDDPSSRRALIVSRDISEVKAVESRLRDSRERFRLIAENAYDMIAEFDAKGRVHYMNARVANILGMSHEQWRDDPEILLHPEDRELVARMIARALEEDVATTATYRIAHADGSWRWVEARYRSARTASGEQRVVLIARDRSHDIDAEQRLIASEMRYRELVEKSPLGIVVLQNQRVVFANAAGASTCGADSARALTGTPLHSLLERSDALPLQRIPDEHGATSPQETLLEVRVRGLDGQVRDVVATGTRIEFEGAPAFQVLVRDITGLRRAERERQRLELQLQESRKLESLGMLAGGIAHDFNNLLAVILANARFALRHGAKDSELSEALEETIEAGERAARLTKQLLAYAGRREPDVRTVDIGELVEATNDILRSVIPNHVELTVDLDPTTPPVRADAVQIEQVLMNLVINAADASGEAPGSVRVATGTAEIRGEERLHFVEGGDLADGLYAYLEVSDTGRGMDSDTAARIFEPFFTTKAEGHGLGLAAVIGLVKGHRGAVELVSTPSEGTRFRVYLPASADLVRTPPPRVAEDASAMLWIGELDALRDDPAWELRDITRLEASDESDALVRLERDGGEIALLVCDADTIANPARFLEDVQVRRAGLPVLWCGAFSGSMHGAAGPLEPWTPESSLADALESLLGKP